MNATAPTVPAIHEALHYGLMEATARRRRIAEANLVALARAHNRAAARCAIVPLYPHGKALA